jgi:TolB protein
MKHRRAILVTALIAPLALASAAALAHAQMQMRATAVPPAHSTGNGTVGGTDILPVEHNLHCATSRPQANTQSQSRGLFDASADIGSLPHPGTTAYAATTHNYMLASGGENIWGTADAFQFAYKKMSGDVDLSADISFIGTGVNPHRKAVLMIRKSLDAGSPYVDGALHGSGLLSLQYRDAPSGFTTEIETMAPIYAKGLPVHPFAQGGTGFRIDIAEGGTNSVRLRLVKRGTHAYLYIAPPASTGVDGKLEPSGASIPMPFDGDFYVGIGLSSHEKVAVESAIFSNVTLKEGSPTAVAGLTTPQVYSALEVIDVDSTIRHIRYVQPARFEAPNWTRDGSAFNFNRDGRIWRFPAAAPDPVATGAPPPPLAEPVAIDTGFATRCNNDHGISPDGTQIVVSDNSQDTHDSIIYTLPITGSSAATLPHRVTKNSPSYWHGWSPDGKTLAFVGQRNGDFDIFTIPADATNSQNETRLTTAKGLDDGPEYTPDGQWIYFNSERTGDMQIWRMHPDGSQQEQVTHDDWNNWFPHFSPDGKWMVMLSYDKSVEGHPENKDVQLRLMSLPDGKITTLARLFGGQGTINVPSWSPDSKHLAFVSYELLLHEDAR